jgi:hypothetical protein
LFKPTRPLPHDSPSLREKVGVRATAVEKAKPWTATVATLTPALSQREREQYIPTRPFPHYSPSLWEKVGVRATAVEKAKPWIATVATLTPALFQREREQYIL